MNSYSIFVGVAHDELKVQTISPFEYQSSASQNYCMRSVNFEIQTIIKNPWISGLILTGETDSRVWYVCIFALTLNTPH